MRKITLIAILLAGSVGSFAKETVKSKTSPSTAKGITFTIRTDKERYALGETVTATLTWQNTTDKELKMETSPSMGIVRVFNQETKKEAKYMGVYACGGISYKTLASGEKFEIRNTLNYFLNPNYDLTKPGRYSIDYGNNYTTFEIVRLDETALAREREKAVTGDKSSLQIIAAHGDEKIEYSLIELVKSSDEETRKTVYRTLLLLNTENSMRILAEAAANNLPPLEKLNILRSLYEMKADPNPVVIFYMRKLLEDDFINGYSTTQTPGEPPKRYKLYTVRKYAYLILKRFNIEAPVVYQEEIIEDQVKQ